MLSFLPFPQLDPSVTHTKLEKKGGREKEREGERKRERERKKEYKL